MMRGRLAAISFAAALAAVPALAAAEGRGMGRAATGRAFDLPAGVSVERLEVHVSFYSVRLAYVFKSRKRLTVHFSFAMPEMPVDAAEDLAALDTDSEVAGLAADTQPANYMNLAVRVEGKPVVLGGHGRALLDGKDVTRQLLNAGVPLLSGPGGSAWRHLTPDVRTKLEASRLINIDAAAWAYQADFEWDQPFEPGETRTAAFTLPASRLSYPGFDMAPRLDDGRINILAGTSARREELVSVSIEVRRGASA
mgnify:CR=1 FL=1